MKKHHTWKEKVKGLKKVMHDSIYAAIPVSETPNCIYKAKTIKRVVIETIGHQDFIETYTEYRRENGARYPSGDTVYYRQGRGLEGRSHNDVFDGLMEVNEALLEEVDARGFFKKPAYIGIDGHDQAWFRRKIPRGKKRKNRRDEWFVDANKFSVGTKKFKGTNQAHRLIMADIVEPERRFSLGGSPVTPFHGRTKALGETLQQVKKRVQVKMAFLDREFINSHDIKVMNDMGIPWTGPMPRNKKIKEILPEARKRAKVDSKGNAVYVIDDYTMETGAEEVYFQVVFLFRPEENRRKDQPEEFIFATNTPVTVDTAMERAEEYNMRWGIETDFRQRILCRSLTCTQDFRLRILFQLLAMILFNLWQLCSHIIAKWPWERYPVPLKRFVRGIFTLDGPPACANCGHPVEGVI